MAAVKITLNCQALRAHSSPVPVNKSLTMACRAPLRPPSHLARGLATDLLVCVKLLVNTCLNPFTRISSRRCSENQLRILSETVNSHMQHMKKRDVVSRPGVNGTVLWLQWRFQDTSKGEKGTTEKLSSVCRTNTAPPASIKGLINERLTRQNGWE